METRKTIHALKFGVAQCCSSNSSIHILTSFLSCMRNTLLLLNRHAVYEYMARLLNNKNDRLNEQCKSKLSWTTHIQTHVPRCVCFLMVKNKSNLYFFYIALTMIFVKLQFTLFMCVLCKKETSILIRYSSSTKANLALLDAIKSLCFVFYYFREISS